jgi:hypothetical protein
MKPETWTRAEPGKHPLAQLGQTAIGGSKLAVWLGPKNRYGARYFRIGFADGPTESEYVMLGLQHAGPRPSLNWIEVIKLNRQVKLGNREVAVLDRDVESLFSSLSNLVPAGGHVMVQYDTEEWEDTRRSMACGVPEVATALGRLLFDVGCGVAFKNWFFAEGGSEGPRKLQGYKALNEEHWHSRTRAMAGQLREFLNSEGSGPCVDLWKAAQERARDVLSAVEPAVEGSP